MKIFIRCLIALLILAGIVFLTLYCIATAKGMTLNEFFSSLHAYKNIAYAPGPELFAGGV